MQSETEKQIVNLYVLVFILTLGFCIGSFLSFFVMDNLKERITHLENRVIELENRHK